ncbi:MAG: NAD(P)-dependent oxidoreductase [Candidatus Aminicenantes bacterium]|nr:NAD(P)-dependent oxidoreductase [Candidatus Aminicenantes bacterium]
MGWIGTGVMGKAMALNLLKEGRHIFAYSRTKEKANELINRGAAWCDTPAEVTKHSKIIFTIVGFPADVEEVMFGSGGLINNAAPGSIIIDMTTSQPSLAKKINEAAQKRSIDTLDAPVSGGDVGAGEGKLAIMVGGAQKAYDKILPLFKILGENIALLGGPGSGQHTKMSNQILIASTMMGTVESLLYAQKAGLDRDSVIDIIGKGAAASWSINNLGRRMVAGNFDPGFFIKHFVKDMGIALEEARKMNLSLPGLALANQFYISAMALGLENMGTQALYNVLEKLNDMQHPAGAPS